MQLLPNNLFAENWTAAGTELSFPQHELEDLADRGGCRRIILTVIHCAVQNYAIH
jgi:hypothetical protein